MNDLNADSRLADSPNSASTSTPSINTSIGHSSTTGSAASLRRQMLLNHVLLVETAHQHGHTEAYEELKRLIIFAGIFFLFVIIFVLLKFQVSLDDVFKFSPIIWLVGVIVCGLLMNIFIQIKKFFKRKRAKRLREQQNLLYSLNLPTSFPCLAPPPHTPECCQCMADALNERYGIFNADSQSLLQYCQPQSTVEQIPSYEQSSLNVRPPSYSNLNRAQETQTENPACIPGYSTSTNQNDVPPPGYYDTQTDSNILRIVPERRTETVVNITHPESVNNSETL